MAVELGSTWRRAPFEKAHQDGTHIQRILASSAGRVLASTIACWLVAFVFCKYQFWRDPHSTFFDSSAAYEMKYTNLRRSEAKVLIDSAWIQPNESSKTSTDPLICAAVVSVKRRQIQYLNETIGSLLVGLTEEERSALNLRVLFADIDPSVHPDYESEWLKLVDHWSGYNVSEEQLEILSEYKRTKNVRPKAIFDYTYMLDQCYNETTAPYIAVFEDDIIFADSWLAKAISALSEISQKTPPWLYLRLFYTDIMLGWDKKIDPLYTNPIINYALALIVTYAAAFALQRRLRHSRDQSEINAINVITCITIPAFITLIYMVGRNSIFPLEGLQRMDVKGCCTQALIYPRSQVHDLKDRLLGVRPGQTDMMIEKYANEIGIARYALAPSLVQHVGKVSSRGSRKTMSKRNWAYYFETFNAKKLRKEHDELLAGWTYWRAYHGSYGPLDPE